MAGKTSGVNVTIKQYFPHAVLIHCYAHRLHCCKVITQVKIFIANLTGFNRSSKRSELLIEHRFKLLIPSETILEV